MLTTLILRPNYGQETFTLAVAPSRPISLKSFLTIELPPTRAFSSIQRVVEFRPSQAIIEAHVLSPSGGPQQRIWIALPYSAIKLKWSLKIQLLWQKLTGTLSTGEDENQDLPGASPSSF